MITPNSNRFATLAHPRNAALSANAVREQFVGSYELRVKL